MPDREQLTEVAVALAVVIVMIGSMAYIGSLYGEDNGTLSPEGGELLVVAIVGFIVLVTAVGIVLAFVTNEPESDPERGTDEGGSETGGLLRR